MHSGRHWVLVVGLVFFFIYNKWFYFCFLFLGNFSLSILFNSSFLILLIDTYAVLCHPFLKQLYITNPNLLLHLTIVTKKFSFSPSVHKLISIFFFFNQALLSNPFTIRFWKFIWNILSLLGRDKKSNTSEIINCSCWKQPAASQKPFSYISLNSISKINAFWYKERKSTLTLKWSLITEGEAKWDTVERP